MQKNFAIVSVFCCSLLTLHNVNVYGFQIPGEGQLLAGAKLSRGVVFHSGESSADPNDPDPFILSFNPSNPSPALASPGSPPRVLFLDETVPQWQPTQDPYLDSISVDGPIRHGRDQKLISPQVQPNVTQRFNILVPGPPFNNQGNLGPPTTDVTAKQPSVGRPIFSNTTTNFGIKPPRVALLEDTTIVRKQEEALGAQNEGSRVSEGNHANDRWSWPRQVLHSASLEPHRPLIPQARQSTISTIERTNDSAGNVANHHNPVQVFAKVSRCPKLLTNLKVLCTVTPPHYPVVLSWKKRIFASNNSPAREILLSQGNLKRTTESRYSIGTLDSVPDSTLTIQRLKTQDCGVYTCEARDRQGVFLGSSDVLVFLCF